MTFRSLITFFCLLSGFVSCLLIVAIIGITLMFGSHFLVMHRAVMALVVQFATVACLWNLVVLHYFVYFAPGLTEAVTQGMGAHHIPGE